MPLVILALVCCGLLWVLWTYNRLMRWRVSITQARHAIEIQEESRDRLMLQLAAIVDDHWANHQELMDSILETRKQLGQRAAYAEDHPEPPDPTEAVVREVAECEEKISFAQTFYNEQVAGFNLALAQVPTRWIAHLAKLPAEPFWGPEEV